MTGKAATRSDEVRVLPFRVRPLPDEPFDSWLEKMAATYGATMNEMACALGLIEQEKGLAVSATAWMADKWATTLTEEQAARLPVAPRASLVTTSMQHLLQPSCSDPNAV